jgi:dihydroneopterin aldolase
MEPRIARRGLRHVFIRDLVLSGSIGVYPHEKSATQRVRATVGRDELARVVNYERVAQAVRRIVGAGHVMLVETLAERIAEACLVDTRVQLVRVRVEKLDVFPDAGSAGVEIERYSKLSTLAIDTQ